MATLRDLKSRIVGISNTQQITKAMKMVAAARLRRAQENMINARPYTRKLSEVLNHLISIEKNIKNPLLETRPEKNIAIVVITSDRGLCGAFNINITREVEQLSSEEYSELFNEGKLNLYCIGKKGNDYFTKRKYNIAGSYPGIFSKLSFDFASKLVNDLSQKFIIGEHDKIILVYNKFKSVIQQELTVEQFLPIMPFDSSELDPKKFSEYIYEPDKKSIINSLLPRHLKAQLWGALLESYAAELGARMTAMDMATENATELIRQLKITFNKERQAAITKEILEIVSGANALKSN